MKTYSIGTCVQLIHEPLVPGVDAVLQHVLDGLEQTFFAPSFGLRQRELEELHQLFWPA